MAVENGWGEGAVNNTNDWGKAKANSTNGFGKIYETSNAGLTNIVGGSPVVSISYSASAFCVDASDPTPTVSNNAGAGTFSSTTGLVFISTSTGQVDVSASTAGTYTITYTDTDSAVATFSLTVNALDNAAFTYSASSYPQDDSDPSPTVTGLTGGTFSAGSGLVFVDSGTNTGSSTGQIDLSASTIASYTITYDTTSSGSSVCPNTSTQTVAVASSFTNTYSVELDGVNDRVLFTQTNFMNSDDEASYSFWIKPDAYGGSSNYGYLIGGNHTSKGGFGYSEGGSSGSHFAGQIYYYNGSSATYTGVAITQSVWNHIVLVFETGGTLKTYKNGSLAATSTGITFGSSANRFDRIGHLGGTSHYANGKMDEFGIWSSALTASNVTTLYNNGVPNDISSLSPVLWYRFEEGSGTSVADSGSGSLTGTLSNGAAFSTDVPFNTRSIQLDGVNDYIDFGESVLHASSATVFTISAWININNVSADMNGSVANIIADAPAGSPTNGGFWLAYDDRNTSVSPAEGISYNIKTSAGFQRGKSNDNVISSNTWTHIALVLDGQATLYINGVDSTNRTTDNSGTLSTQSNELTIGAFDDLSFFYKGLIDEAAIWTSALTSSQVTSIYNNGVPNDISSLNPISWYRFEEGTGTTATDSGSSGNNGTLTNGAAYSTDVP